MDAQQNASRWSNILSLGFVEEMYDAYRSDPSAVSEEWRRFFSGEDGGNGQLPPAVPRPTHRPSSVFNPAGWALDGRNGRPPDQLASLQDRIDQMVRAYRVRGHMLAELDPLGRPRSWQPELDPAFYGFRDEHYDLTFSARTVGGPDASLTLRQIVDKLRSTYCRHIGVQFMHIDDLDIRHWLQDRMEGCDNRLAVSRLEQLRILTRLTDAVIFEEFIQKKYTGAKSFSLEGAESLIPLLDMAIERAGAQGVKEIVLAMAHRGRLNVLANIIHKSPTQIFREFEDVDPKLHLGRGDVKYHLGYSNDWITMAGRKIHMSLCFNPSHLEYVNPVAMGRARAKQDRGGDDKREQVMVIQIHGDASFAGEGIIQETLNLSELGGYHVGGSLHVIINNQIGFTTGPNQGRSSLYCSAIGKMLQIPIFHVNGEDPESVAQVIQLALDFRNEFKRDVIVDMYCYRRHGHNEGDEPAFTQPLLYGAISKRESVRDAYLKHLLALGEVSEEEADRVGEHRLARLEKELSVARRSDYQPPVQTGGGVWTGYAGGPEKDAPRCKTGVPVARLKELLAAQTKLPDDFHPHRKVSRILKGRAAMATGEKPLDWAAAEALAFATLAVDGHPIRMTGQDCERGTFSHRHAVLHDVETGERYTPLQHLTEDQAGVEICNSPLSESGVMGFEYGYSLDCPSGLVAWEAQFGDFSNVAQVIIDQFIASGEDKWHRLSGLVLLLPHGLEGQGPEHCSARLERYLLLAAEDNIQVVNLTTPAQYFHCLRRQVVRKWRKPLFVMTPKSLLRHPQAVSSLEELAEGGFQRIIPDSLPETETPPRRVLLCSGKVYYELLAAREEKQAFDVALVRVEQIFPLTQEELAESLSVYPDETPVYWVQEEPNNMGAWRYFYCAFGPKIAGRWPLHSVTRPASASPATGSAASHRLEQAELIERAFAE
jgi:2-oxoglutarate dehydrogenase E1 component